MTVVVVIMVVVVVVVAVCVYISATVPELAKHEVGVVVHRAKRVQRFECPTMNDVNDLR